MADGFGGIVGGFALSPAHRDAGDVVGMAGFALQRTRNQVLQHNVNGV